MSLYLSFGKFNNYEISDSRVNRMLNSNREIATHMGLWDKFKDLFRTEKKAEALEELYNLIHGSTKKNPVQCFKALKDCAGSAYMTMFKTFIDKDTVFFSIADHVVSRYKLNQVFSKEEFTENSFNELDAFYALQAGASKEDMDKFTIDCDESNVSFSINNVVSRKCKLHELMHIPENIKLKSMTEEEKKLFLPMLHTTCSTFISHPNPQGVSPGKLRAKASEKYKEALYLLYRPDDLKKQTGTQFVTPTDFTEEKKQLLNDLNAGNAFDISVHTVFAKICYRKNEQTQEPKFTMIHPSILYLLGSYSYGDANSQETNGNYLKVLHEDYEKYININNKTAIDAVLAEIYKANGETLHVSDERGENRNCLFLAKPVLQTPEISVPKDFLDLRLKYLATN